MATTCPWPIDVQSCCQSTGLDPDVPEDAAKIESVVAQVSDMLSRWSGYRFGGCRTVRPLEPCGECRASCCSQGDCIVLHSASSVSEVRLEGEVVSPAEYVFDGARGTLCAVPPLTWPRRDPRSDAVAALEVDVMVGDEPDAWALAVAAELACELLLACAGKQCRIPRNATQVTHQGVTITLSHDELMFAIPSVVAWVTAVNPHRATAPARVLSPEAKRAKVRGRSPIRF